MFFWEKNQDSSIIFFIKNILFYDDNANQLR